MGTESIKDRLRELKLKGMLEEFEAQIEGDSYDGLSFTERFSLIVEAEQIKKRNSRTQLRHRQANFAQKGACIEDIDYTVDRNLSKETVLRLASCAYAGKHENVLVLGPSDSGKTYLSCALGNAACRRDIKVSYSRLADLFSVLEQAERVGRLTKVFRFYSSVPILIIDDFLLSVPTLRQVQTLVELSEQRERTTSTIVCAQLHPRDWSKRIDEAIQANCIHSRLVPGAHVIELKGGMPMRERYSSLNEEGR